MRHPTHTTLFIYGTLKRGGVRDRFLIGQRFLGEARTRARYRMFNTGDYPALVEAADPARPGLAIVGELWRVDDATLARLDHEEGVDDGLYERRAIDLVTDTTDAQAYFYLRPVDGLTDCGACWPIGG